MNKKAFIVAKTNFSNVFPAWLVFGLLLLLFSGQDFIKLLVEGSDPGRVGAQLSISIGNMVYFLVVLCAVLIPALNLKKIINLGGKRIDFFWGCLFGYVGLAAAASLFNVICFFTYDKFFGGFAYFEGVANFMNVFGWSTNGMIIAFFQQFAFLFLLAIFFHTMTTLQDRWIGWVADIAVVVIIFVTPITDFIIFGKPALQIISCLLLAAVFYTLSKPILARKKI